MIICHPAEATSKLSGKPRFTRRSEQRKFLINETGRDVRAAAAGDLRERSQKHPVKGFVNDGNSL